METIQVRLPGDIGSDASPDRRSIPGKALHILIIENEAFIAALLSEVLVEAGHTVCAIVSTEASAVVAAALWQPNLMIVDVKLSEGNGISAVEKILLNGFIPHVFMTGNPLRGLSLSPGSVVIQKPFMENDLFKAIEQALSVQNS